MEMCLFQSVLIAKIPVSMICCPLLMSAILLAPSLLQLLGSIFKTSRAIEPCTGDGCDEEDGGCREKGCDGGGCEGGGYEGGCEGGGCWRSECEGVGCEGGGTCEERRRVVLELDGSPSTSRNHSDGLSQAITIDSRQVRYFKMLSNGSSHV